MNLNLSVSQWLKIAGASIEKNKTGILTGIGIASETGAIIHGMWVSPRIRDEINIRKDELAVEKLPPKEILRIVWKPLLPTIALWGTGCYCLIKSNQISESKGAFAAAAASIAESTINDIKREAKEEKKEKVLNDLEDKAAVKNIQTIVIDESKFYDTGLGDDLILDPICQDGMKHKMSLVQQRILTLNQEYQQHKEEFVNYDEFRTCLGFPPNNFAKCLWFKFDERGPIEMSFAVAPVPNSDMNMNVIRYNYWPTFVETYTKNLPNPQDMAIDEYNNVISRTRQS